MIHLCPLVWPPVLESPIILALITLPISFLCFSCRKAILVPGYQVTKSPLGMIQTSFQCFTIIHLILRIHLIHKIQSLQLQLMYIHMFTQLYIVWSIFTYSQPFYLCPWSAGRELGTNTPISPFEPFPIEVVFANSSKSKRLGDQM